MRLSAVSQVSATGQVVHPNDHVNMSQSSNDVIPTAIHVSAYLEVTESLIPALEHLQGAISRKATGLDDVVVTGRTHLMDALPLRLSQELGGWSHQIERGIEGVLSTLPRLAELAVGGTAVGNGSQRTTGIWQGRRGQDRDGDG